MGTRRQEEERLATCWGIARQGSQRNGSPREKVRLLDTECKVLGRRGEKAKVAESRGWMVGASSTILQRGQHSTNVPGKQPLQLASGQ